MEQISIAIDLYSALICAMLLCSLHMGAARSKRLSRWFTAMCLCNIGALISDLPNWLCTSYARPWYPFALRAACIAQYLFAGLLLAAYTGYVVAYLGQSVRVRRAFPLAAGLLIALYLLGVLLTLQNGMFFSFSEANAYRRGPWYGLSQLLSVACLLVDTAAILFYRKHIRRKAVAVFLGYIVFPFVGVAVQARYYGLTLTYTASTAALLFIYINIEAEQELLLRERERELAESRIEILLSQIQPHFLYNTLAAIRQLCDTDPRQAQEAVTEFSDFLRANMASLTRKQPIPFEQELRHVKNYLSLEQRRYGERLRVTYEIGASGFSLPPLSVQPLVENAVRYGAAQRVTGGAVAVRTRETPDAYVVTVQDDGPGFKLPGKGEDERSHVGLQNVRSRLQAMCGGTLTIESVPSGGTAAVISLPKSAQKEGEAS